MLKKTVEMKPMDTSYTNANRKRIEQNEEELKELEGKNEEVSDEQKEESSKSVEEPKGEEKTWKKRYGDLRAHSKEKDARIAELEKQLEQKASGPSLETQKDLEAWVEKNPRVAAVVEQIAERKAKEMFAKADERLQSLDEYQKETLREKAYAEIRKAHSDFDKIKDDDNFHDWVAEQPRWVRDAAYENEDDAGSVIRVLDLYKQDLKKSNSREEAARSVPRGGSATPDSGSGKAVFSESYVQKMSKQKGWFEKNEEKIMEAIANGNFEYDLSGAAQ